MTKTLFLLSLPLFLLASCGFEPVYGKHSSSASPAQGAGMEAATGLSAIDVAIVPDREGQILRNELIDQLRPHGGREAKYTLSFADLIVNVRKLDLTKNAEATRAQIIVTTNIYLTDLETGALVLSRPVKSISSYNVLPSKFATRVTEQNARENALRDAARQIVQQLSLFFNRPVPREDDSAGY